jgi:hypothetical protein
VECGEKVCSEVGEHKVKVFRNPSATRPPPLQPSVSSVNNELSAETQARFSAYSMQTVGVVCFSITIGLCTRVLMS